jgi:serine/threonine protein kinase
MVRLTFNEANAAFRNVLGNDILKSGVSDIIDKMAVNYNELYFTGLIANLSTISSIGENLIIDKGRHHSRKGRNSTQYWASGAVGKIRKGEQEKSLVYKIIEIDSVKPDILEKKIRQVFIESWIQTILCNDSLGSKYVAKIKRMYRDISLERGWEKKQKKCILYISMEFCTYNLSGYLHSFNNPTLEMVKPQLLQLGEALKYLYDTYNFRHKDLHEGNLMFSKDKSIKLIDFGRSCISFEKDNQTLATFSASLVPVEMPTILLGNSKSSCYSKDLLTFLVSVLEFHKADMSDSLYVFLKKLVTTKSGLNLHLYAKRLGEIKNPQKPEYAFWQTYPATLKSWSPEMQMELYSCETLTPEGFIKALEVGLSGGKTRRNRKRLNRTKRSKN